MTSTRTASHVPATTEQHERVLALLQNDDYVDAPGVGVQLHGEAVELLLSAYGWEKDPAGHGSHAYTRPGGTPRSLGGRPGSDYVWSREEALKIALTAEALGLGLEA